MSDAELRALERRWRESGSSADEEALLRARVRQGVTTPARVEVAAICGHKGARALLPDDRKLVVGREALATLCGVTAATVSKWTRQRKCPHIDRGQLHFDPIAVLDWRVQRLAYPAEGDQAATLLASALHGAEPEAAKRAALAAAWVAVLGQGDDARSGEQAARLVASEQALVDPGAARPSTRRPSSEAWIDTLDLMRLRENRAHHRTLLLRAVGHAVAAEDVERARAALVAAFWATVVPGLGAIDVMNDREAARHLKASFERLAHAVRQDVVPWALGDADPLAARVARRRAAPVELVVPTFADSGAPAGDEDPRTGAPSRKQLDFLRSLLRQKGLSEADAIELLSDGDVSPRVETLERRDVSRLIDRLQAAPDSAPARRPAPAPAEKPVEVTRPAALEDASPGAKLGFKGKVTAARPRISLALVNGEPKHGYEGYVLLLDGQVEGTAGSFAIAIGEAAGAKNGFQVGDTVSGAGVLAAGSTSSVADLYKASGLAVESRDSPAAGEPPWLGPPPPLADYRARGHVDMKGAGGPECRSCIWACRMPTEGEAKPVAVCYGPAECRLRPAR
jgi:hypothetical protein